MLGARCVVPVNAGLAMDPPAFKVRFDVHVKEEALARAIATLRPDVPGQSWAPTVEVLFAPTGRISPHAFRKKQRHQDWIEGRLIALRMVIDVPASAKPSAKTTQPPVAANEDEEQRVDDSEATTEVVLAEYFFK